MPGGYKNIKASDNPSPWSKDNQPANSGRKKKLVSHINTELKEDGYEPVTNEQVITAFQTLVNLPVSKIMAIANKNILYKDEQGEIVYLQEGDEYPLLYRLVAKELMSKRGAEYLDKVLDRIIGKARQSVDITTPTQYSVTIID